MAQLNGKTGGLPGRPKKDCSYQGCPKTEYCKITGGCKDACGKIKNASTTKGCGAAGCNGNTPPTVPPIYP